jgi:hypothetical protein
VRATGPATDRGTTQVASTGQERKACVPRWRREGNLRLWPQGGGAEPARTSRQAWSSTSDAWRKPSQQGAWRAGGALERDRADFQPVNPLLTTTLSKKLNCATKTVDTNVVETSLYNICKGCPMFFSLVWAGTPSNVLILQSTDE